MAAKRLLLIDDEPEFGRLVKRIAEEQDYEVTVTQLAAEFMKAYDKIVPSHIILDIVMPGTDGIELMKWLIERGSDARVICVSGYDPDYAKLAETLGNLKSSMSVTSLIKPIRLADLRSALSGD